jgi:hypothetical protein
MHGHQSPSPVCSSRRAQVAAEKKASTGEYITIVLGRKKFPARHPENEDVDLAIRSEGTCEKVVVEEVLRAVAEDDAWSGHHAAQRVPDHPYLTCQLSRGETWTDPQGGLPKLLQVD